MLSYTNIIKFFIAGFLGLNFLLPALASTVSIDPLYLDARFAPADKLHAGCVNSTNIMFDAQGDVIENVHLVMSYNPSDIQIVSVVSDIADVDLINYNIQDDKVVLNFLNQKGKKLDNVPLFKVSFKSLSALTSSVLGFEKGSYALNKDSVKIRLTGSTALGFESVLECDPDVVPPSVSLLNPKNTVDQLPLDAYFVFDVEDNGKGVDKQSVQIDFAGEHYTSADTQYLQRKDNYLVFYPKNRLPVGQKLSLDIVVSDNQSYGGANVLKKEFNFESASEMLLLNDVRPDIYRAIVKKSVLAFASSGECMILKEIYGVLDTSNQPVLKNILQKVACDTENLSSFIDNSVGNGADVHAASLIISPSKNAGTADKKMSVFAVLGWTLFAIALMLKLYYYVEYRKHKKFYNKHKHLVVS